MKRENLYLSTIDPKAGELAARYGLGLEIAEYCTAYNMDDFFADTDALVAKKLKGIGSRLLHAPFNELFPCAIDPKARELAAARYRQAVSLANRYDADKIIIHGGYNPWLYYPCWYTEQSIIFWDSFLKDYDGPELVLENVLEEKPDMLVDIVRTVDHPKLRICLDVGHVNAYSKLSIMNWLESCAPYLSHFHLHNNDGSFDSHHALDMGTLPIRDLLIRADSLCADATCTLELPDAESSIQWLFQQ